VDFETGSQLRVISRFAFRDCPDLLSICLSRLLETIDGAAFGRIQKPEFAVDPANQHFELLDHFVVETKSRSLVLYFGNVEHVVIPSSIRCISPLRRYFEGKARSIEFESPSTVAEFDESAFEWCNCDK
jgi:hypothetical protein